MRVVVRYGTPGGADLEAMLLAVWSQIHGLTTIVLETPVSKTLPAAAAEDLARDGVARLVTGIGAR